MGEEEALDGGAAILREEDAGGMASSSSSEMTIARRRLPKVIIPGGGDQRERRRECVVTVRKKVCLANLNERWRVGGPNSRCRAAPRKNYVIQGPNLKLRANGPMTEFSENLLGVESSLPIRIYASGYLWDPDRFHRACRRTRTEATFEKYPIPHSNPVQWLRLC